MEESRRIARGLIAAHIITVLISATIGFATSFVLGLISFALILPLAAYISPKVLENLLNNGKSTSKD